MDRARRHEDEGLPRNSELGEKVSAIVGETSYVPNDNVKIKYNFSLDSNLDDKTLSQIIELSGDLEIAELLSEEDFFKRSIAEIIDSIVANA